MIATKFEPHDNWLPPCYFVPKELERALIEAGVPACQWNQVLYFVQLLYFVVETIMMLFFETFMMLS